MFNGYFKNSKPEIVFAGFNMSSEYASDLLSYLKNKSVYVNVVSKSGTTLEPSIAFDLIYHDLKKRYSKEELAKRIIVTTDKEKGTLKELANKEGYTSFIVPDKIGGRYSVLSSVGLFPLEVANISSTKLLKGAKIGKKYLNQAFEYACIRDILSKKGKSIESYTVYEPKLYYFSEWLKQLFAETQGKNNLGIFPVSLVNSRDLHSLGQFLQEGNPLLFETVIVVENNIKVKLEKYKQDLNKINLIASDKVALAHFKGHTPSIMIKIDEINEENIGALIYFFEVAAATGAYLLNVNPFDQPGVSEYKNLLHGALEEK
jgi:glucose-6-phosphate isomerase